MNNEETAIWRRSATVAILVTLALEGFVARAIRHVSSGGVLDDASVAAIKDDSIRNLKNMEATGLPIEADAEVFHQAIAQFNRAINRAVAEGRDTDTD